MTQVLVFKGGKSPEPFGKGEPPTSPGHSYVLHSGRTATVHVERVLQHNQDPTYLRDLLLCTA